MATEGLSWLELVAVIREICEKWNYARSNLICLATSVKHHFCEDKNWY